MNDTTNNNYLVTFSDTEVISILSVAADAEITGVSDRLITSLENAKVMLSALGIDITRLNEYRDTEGE